MKICTHQPVLRVLSHVAFRSFADDSLFPGRKLSEVIVELNTLLNSDDIRLFETDM